MAGIEDNSLFFKEIEVEDSSLSPESGGFKLRYRFESPPTVTSVRPGRSNVQCKFVACLDGD